MDTLRKCQRQAYCLLIS